MKQKRKLRPAIGAARSADSIWAAYTGLAEDELNDCHPGPHCPFTFSGPIFPMLAPPSCVFSGAGQVLITRGVEAVDKLSTWKLVFPPAAQARPLIGISEERPSLLPL